MARVRTATAGEGLGFLKWKPLCVVIVLLLLLLLLLLIFLVVYWSSPGGSDCGIVNVNIPTSGAEIGGAFGEWWWWW